MVLADPTHASVVGIETLNTHIPTNPDTCMGLTGTMHAYVVHM